MLFRECYVTNSICGPMRAVVQTGKYSHLNGFWRNGLQFDVDQPTFPKLLQRAGYQTAIIGKYHLGHRKDPQGFDHYEILIGQGPYYNPTMIRKGAGRVKHTGYTTDIITDLAIEWLKKGRDASKPFCLLCHHKAPTATGSLTRSTPRSSARRNSRRHRPSTTTGPPAPAPPTPRP